MTKCINKLRKNKEIQPQQNRCCKVYLKTNIIVNLVNV